MIDIDGPTWKTILAFAEPQFRNALAQLRTRGQDAQTTEYHRGVADVLEGLLKLAKVPVGIVAEPRKGYPAPAPDHTHAGRPRPVEPKQPTA